MDGQTERINQKCSHSLSSGDNGVAVVGHTEPLVDVVAEETIPLTESTHPQPISTPPYDNRVWNQ